MDLIAPMFSGPVDVIGDIHGEIDALETLLVKLGYDDRGGHPDGRRLVFVGDLTDRGPDSPAVLERVMALVSAGRAQCIIGNHELNLLRGDPKHGNEWFLTPNQPGEHGQASVPAGRKAAYLEFLHTLPLALEREDLRVVHACWHHDSIGHLTAAATQNAVEVYHDHESMVRDGFDSADVERRLREEHEAHGASIRDPEWADPVILEAHAEMDRAYQMNNPVRVLTSGTEQRTPRPFWSSGKWRMLERGRWWERYDDAVPVIMGHYWRRLNRSDAIVADKFGPDMFAGIEPNHWMGRRNNVYCIDFSVGGRSSERARGRSRSFVCQLSALRVPEWQIVHDEHDEVWALGRPGQAKP